jgi:hypothetical protein
MSPRAGSACAGNKKPRAGARGFSNRLLAELVG